MKSKIRTSCKYTNCILLSIVMLLCSYAIVHAGSLPETAKLVPPETILLLEIDDFSQLEDQFQKTNFYKLYKDPSMTAFIDDLKAKWQGKIRQADSDIIREIIDIAELPQGRMAVALVFGRQTTDINEPSLLLITQWGHKLTKIKESVDALVKKKIEQGARKKTENYNSLAIETVIDKDSSAFSYLFFEDYLIASDDTELIKFVIAHTKSSNAPTLVDDPDYNSTIQAVGPYHDVDFYINIKQIIKTILASDTSGNAQTVTTNLGLDNVTALGASIAVNRIPGSSLCSKSLLKIAGNKKGICKIMEPESSAIKVPAFIPSSACSIAFSNLNLKKTYDELYNIMYNFSPLYAALMHTPLLPPGEPAMDLKSNIIEHLGSQIIIIQNINKPFSKSSSPTESLLAVATNNSQALEGSISLLHDKIIAKNNPDTKRRFLGHTVYLIDISGRDLFQPQTTPEQNPIDSGSPRIPKLALTITDTHLIVGLESTVEQAIRTLSGTDTVSVASKKWFRNATSFLPSTVGCASMENNIASGELLWCMLKQASQPLWGQGISGTAIAGSPSINLSPKEISELVNPALLPEFDAVRKYFGSSVSYAISRPDGLFFELKYINPKIAD